MEINICNFVNLTIQDFKDRFTRGFVYEIEGVENTPSTILDNDIQIAYNQALGDWDCGLWNNSEIETKENFLLLSAFYLLQGFKMNDGLNATVDWLEASKSVGSVSVSNAINQKLLNSPLLSYYMENPFGKKYAIKLYMALINKKRLFTGKPNLA